MFVLARLLWRLRLRCFCLDVFVCFKVSRSVLRFRLMPLWSRGLGVRSWCRREGVVRRLAFFFVFLFLHIPEESPVVLVLGSFPVISPGSISLEGNSSWFNCISIIGRCGVGVVAARRLVPLHRRTACTWIKWSLVCTTELVFLIHYVVFPFSFHFLQPRAVWFVDQRLLERTFLTVLYCVFKRHKIELERICYFP